MSYSGDPSTSALDATRWLLGDTNVADALVTDAEINFSLSGGNDPYSAAALCAEALAAKFSSEVSYNADGVSIDTSILADQYRALALQLRLSKKFANQAASPYVGGISQSDKDRVAGEDDRVGAQFGIGFQDNRQAGADTRGAASDLRGDR